ncbi:MAG: hypothetical protein M0Z30_13220 [Actinomycetota bacterium]|nr:hypothetical protein [Actinomycetota bacterium]
MEPLTAAGRVLVAGLLGWMAWIHLHLWSAGYRHIHTIGPLFLAGAVAAAAMAVVVVVIPSRILVPAVLAAVGLAGGTLVGLAVSVNGGLFGFRDSMRAPFARESVLAESLVLAGGLALVAWQLSGRRRPLRPGSRSDRVRRGRAGG